MSADDKLNFLSNVFKIQIFMIPIVILIQHVNWIQKSTNKPSLVSDGF